MTPHLPESLDKPLSTPEDALHGVEWALALFIFVMAAFIAVALFAVLAPLVLGG